jgi:uncharacterized protein YecE (DUF72 family)
MRWSRSSSEIYDHSYHLPRLTTATKWRKESSAINPQFEFTVKAFQGITHRRRFQEKESLVQFDFLTDGTQSRSFLVLSMPSP